MFRAARALASFALAALTLAPGQGVPAERAGRTRCTGRYADNLSVMTAAARQRESRQAADWVYCLRATAVYEHLAYGRDGKVVHEYHTTIRHGTGFAYRQRGREWLVATNQHVVAFPEVTGDGQELEAIPPGSRLVRVEIRIVENEADGDSPDQIVLRSVLANEPLDLAVLASRQPLRLIPYALGRSADLRIGNAVLVRGYPLGAFMATNAGRVIGLGQRDLERGWDHEDFAIDALLNLGSSGSPVLAVSCRTGAPEVVGIYHAGYRNAQGLNVAVAIDDLRGALEDLRGPQRNPGPAEPAADLSEARAALGRGAVFIPFGRRTVRVDRQGEAVRFAVLDAAFPVSGRVELSIVDRGPAADGRGAEGRAAELRAALWDQLALVLRYRAAEEGREARRAPGVRERIMARVRRSEDTQEELLAALKAGAEGFGQITRSDRDPAAQRTPESGDRLRRGGVELILGQR